MSSRPALSRHSSGDTNISDLTTISQSSGANTSSSSASKPRSHHAKSRRLTAQSVPFKPLAAKTPLITKRWQPLPAVNRDARKAVRPAKQILGCAICGRRECQLITHESLIKSLKKGEGSVIDLSYVDITDEAYKSSYAYHLARTCVHPGLGQGRVDPFHNLPLSGDLDTPHNHSLFHYYFSYETKQGLQVPPVPHLLDDLILNPFFTMAMQDATVCLSVLALATAMYPTNQALPPDAVGALEYSGRAMSLVRKATVAGDPPSDEVIVSQGFLWATYMMILDKPAMTDFADSVYTLVRARGGLKGLGFQGQIEQLIRWLDARYSTVAHVTCTYQDAPDPPASLLVEPPSRKYGSFWESARAAEILSPDVLEPCQDICRKIEVMEDTFTTGMTMSKLWWLMGKILFLTSARSRVMELYDDTGTFNECVILANQLALHFAVDNVCKQRNALISQTEPLVKALQRIHEHFPKYVDYKNGDIELLMWLLFLVVMAPHHFAGKDWARMQLCCFVRGSLEEDEAPADWSLRVWRSMAKFTWSNLKNKKMFDIVCSEISLEIGNKHD
jgi:hypothetical protein